MQIRQIHVMKAIMFMAVAATLDLHAQTLRCDLLSTATTLNGLAARECLDVDTLKGDTLTIPSNVTRIDNNGFALCRKAQVAGADIVFIIDQSGSMGVKYAYTPPSGNTLFYQTLAGCTNSGSPSFPAGFYAIQQLVAAPPQPQYLRLLTDTNGCYAPSGDPYKARATAVTDAIGYLASVSPSSTAGYLAFAGSILPGESQQPLSVTPAANITTLDSKIFIDSAIDNSNFNTPLDSAKIWLTNPALIKTKKQAIIFVSDGSANPADSNGYKFADPNIPIFTIFLGAAVINRDSINLDSLSKLTHGQFYRIPPARPDSIIGVMKSILNQVLNVSNPTAVTVSNTANNQISTGVLANFVEQADSASWQVILDSTLGLQNNVKNPITFITQYSNIATNAISLDTAHFWLKTTGSPGTVSGAPGTVIPGGSNFTDQCFAPSKLTWFNATGIRPPYFTNADATVQTQLRTSPNNGLVSAHPKLRTGAPLPIDTLTPNLLSVFASSDSVRYSASIPLGYNVQPPVGNAILETKAQDSLLAAWVHPRDPQDFAHDTILIQPAEKALSAYFSVSATGSDSLTPATEFDTTVTQVYMFVRGEIGVPGKSYTVTLSTFSGGLLTLPLTPVTIVPNTIAPGLFRAVVPLSQVAPTPPGDLKFSSLGDQMSGTYIDPLYGDQVTCQAGIGQKVHFLSYLQFTDSLGAPLPANTNPALPNQIFWSLNHKNVYLKFTDYRLSQSPVPVTITANSLKLGQPVAQDSEQVSLATTVTLNNDIATWSGNIPLAPSLTPTRNDHTLAGAFLIQVTATAPAHDSTGKPTGLIDTVRMVVAYPDTIPSLTFKDSVNASDSLGPTSVYLTLKAQDFVPGVTSETITATAQCPGPTPGDSVAGLTFAQSIPGSYASGVLVRNILTPSLQDSALSCPADSGVVLHYVDPVYLTSYQWAIPQALTPTAIPSDTSFSNGLNITLQTGTAGAKIVYTLDTSNAILPRPGRPQLYTGIISVLQTTNLKAIATDSGFLRSRVISHTYLKQPVVLLGYVKDLNGDGAADAVYLVFQKPVPSLPASIDSMYWNVEASANRRSADSSNLSLLSLDTLVAYPNTPFAQFLTGIPSGTATPPVVQFPLGGYFNGLRVLLQDSVGPVAHTAEKAASDLKTYTLNGQTITDPDTLTVTVSEPLTPGAWNGAFRFLPGGNCVDPSSIAKSDSIYTVGDPFPTDNTNTSFKFYVNTQSGSASPQVGDCIFLNDNGKFTDLNGNRAGTLGIPLSGNESQKAIRGMTGYPPVSGLTPGTKAYSVANNSSSTIQNTSLGDFEWIPPFDFPPGWTTGQSYTPKVTVTGISDTDGQTSKEGTTPSIAQPMGLSMLQVVTSSRYIATVHLSDQLGRFVKSWSQQFGFNGELQNPSRAANGGSRSFLVWDERDSKEQLAGTGVYIWKVTFETQDSTGTINKETHITRTGLVR